MNELFVGVPLWTIGIKSKLYKRFEEANEVINSFIMKMTKEAREQGNVIFVITESFL